MPASLDKTRNRKRSRSRPRQQKPLSGYSASSKVDAATLASTLQLQEQRRDVVYSLIALGMKLGLLVLGGVSLLKLGFAYYQRVNRHSELTEVLDQETAKWLTQQKRFDRLFTLGGDRRFMHEQDQWIAPNRVRIIWR